VAKCCLVIALACVFIAPAVGAATSTVVVVPEIKLVVPMYTSPSAIWPAIQQAGPAVGMVILNPAIPDRFIYNSSLASLVAAEQAHGIQVMGYIPTDFDNGVVPLNYSEKMVSNYAAWYHVNGYFIDEVNGSCDAGPLSYYTSLSSFARSQPGPDTLIMNPGDDVEPCNVQLANIFVTFEGTYANYLTASLPTWGAGMPKSDFMNLIYGAPNATAMENSIQLAISRNVGIIYVTDNDGPNPYSTLPTYLQQEASYSESFTTTVTQTQSASVPNGPVASSSSSTSSSSRSSSVVSSTTSVSSPSHSQSQPTPSAKSTSTTTATRGRSSSPVEASMAGGGGFASLAEVIVGTGAAFGAGMVVTAILARSRDRLKKR
jgi:hypothetical protein